MVKKKQTYNLIRMVTPQECHWLDRTYETGEIVYKYYGHTFGCIGKKGSAFTQVFDTPPFFELPINAVELIKVSFNK